MLFIVGPRQVGKTTIAKNILSENKGIYLNWDNVEDKEVILDYQKIITKASSNKLSDDHNIIIFDEIHKYKDWKNHLKGFYDSYADKYKIIVTGSARLDLYKKGGDSMMGRYFPYTVFPLSVKEVINNFDYNTLIQKPNNPKEIYDHLYDYGGFPDPFIKQSKQFYKRWINIRKQQFFKEDIRDLNIVHEIGQFELLAYLLEKQIGSTTHSTSLARKIRVSETTIRRWLSILESNYYCFSIRPWSRNISRSLVKDPKIYLWDWSTIEDKGARFENFIASHLKKFTSFWQELGFGNFGLFYLRDKDKKEVDFIVTKDNEPWFMLDAKYSDNQSISKSIYHFQKQLQCQNAFQVVHDMNYVDKSCFNQQTPIIVPARTFLSQLN